MSEDKIGANKERARAGHAAAQALKLRTRARCLDDGISPCTADLWFCQFATTRSAKRGVVLCGEHKHVWDVQINRHWTAIVRIDRDDYRKGDL